MTRPNTGPRPLYSAAQAVQRAIDRVDTGVYELGTGDLIIGDDDGRPWALNNTKRKRDCFGFAVCECYGIVRHRPGYNRGWTDEHGGPTVVDDLNCNSLREEALHGEELAEIALTPAPGLLIMYPTIHLPGVPHPWIGHVKIIVGVDRVTSWAPTRPDWSLLDTIECMPHEPAIVRGTGAGMVAHDKLWPLPQHRTVMVRIIP